MSKEEIEKQLKLSKRQSKDERYDYLCSEFNAINYCINLEKYTNKLQQENKQLQNNWNELKKWVIEQEQKAWDEVSSTFGYVLKKMQELEEEKDERG